MAVVLWQNQFNSNSPGFQFNVYLGISPFSCVSIAIFVTQIQILFFAVGWAISRCLSTTPHPIEGQGGSILNKCKFLCVMFQRNIELWSCKSVINATLNLKVVSLNLATYCIVELYIGN